MDRQALEKRWALHALLDEVYRSACAKITEAENNIKYYESIQDFNTAAYWTKKYGDAWDESEELRIAIDKIMKRA